MTPVGVAKYQQRWLVYLDVLGYREMVRTAVAKRRIGELIEDFRGSIGETMTVLTRQQHSHAARDVRAKVLGDAICVTTAPSDRGGLRALTSAAIVAVSLSLKGMFVRGGIARGGHYDDGSVLPSSALVAAHEEETKAIYPRVVVPDGLLKALESQRRLSPALDDFIRMDADGVRFVHYLHLLHFFDRKCGQAPGVGLHVSLTFHRFAIEERWRAAPRDERVAAKYKWLANYHNSFCREVLPPEALDGCEVELGGIA